MRANIDATRGAVFAEAVAAMLAPELGKAEAAARVAAWVSAPERGAGDLATMALDAVSGDPRLATVDRAGLAAVFDVEAAANRSAGRVLKELDAMRQVAPAPGDGGIHADPVQRGAQR